MQPRQKTSDSTATRPAVRCTCGLVIIDGQALKSRVLLLDGDRGRAKCRCKRWVSVPVAYSAG